MADKYDGEIKLHVSLESDDVVKQAKDIQKEIKVVVDKVGDDVSKETKEIVEEIQQVSKEIDKEVEKIDKKQQKRKTRKPRKNVKQEITKQEEVKEVIDQEKEVIDVEEQLRQEQQRKERFRQQQKIGDLKYYYNLLLHYQKTLKGYKPEDISYIPESKEVDKVYKSVENLGNELNQLQHDIDLEDVDSILTSDESIKRIDTLVQKLKDAQVESSKITEAIFNTKQREEFEKSWAEQEAQMRARSEAQKEAAREASKNLLIHTTDEDGNEITMTLAEAEERRAQKLKEIEEIKAHTAELERQILESEIAEEEAQRRIVESELEIQRIREEIYKSQLQQSEQIIGMVDSALSERDENLMKVTNPEDLAGLYGEMEGIYEYYIHLMEMREQAFNIGEENTQELDARIESTEEQIEKALDAIELFMLESKKVPQETENTTGKLEGLINKAKILYTKLRGLPQQIPKVKQHIAGLFTTIQKMTNSISKLGINTGKTTSRMQNSFKNLFRTILKYGVGITTLVMLFNKLRATVKEDFKLMAQDIPEFGKQMDSLKSSFELFKHSIGSAFEPIANIVIPWLTRLMDYLASLLDLLGQVSAAVFGQTQYVKAVKKTTAALEEGTEAAKDYLSPIDTIHQYTSNNGSGNGSSGGSGVYQLEQVSEDAIGIADKFHQFVDDVLEAIKPFTTALKNLWNEGLSKLANFTWTALKDFYENFLVPIGKWAFGENTGLTRLVNIINDFLNKINWDRLNESLKNFWIAIEPYAEQFGEGLIDFFEKVLTFVRENIIDKFPDWLDKVTEILKNGDPEKARKWGETFGKIIGVLIGLKLLGFLGGIVTKLWKFKDAIAAIVAVELGWEAGNWLYEILTGEHIDLSPLEQMQQIFDSFTDGTYEEGIRGLTDVWIDFSDWLLMSLYDLLDPFADILYYMGVIPKTVYDAYTTASSTVKQNQADKYKASEIEGFKTGKTFEDTDAAQKTRHITELYQERSKVLEEIAQWEKDLGEYDPDKHFNSGYGQAVERLKEIENELDTIKIKQGETGESTEKLGGIMVDQYTNGKHAIEEVNTSEQKLTDQITTDTVTSKGSMTVLGNAIEGVKTPLSNLYDKVKKVTGQSIEDSDSVKENIDTNFSETNMNKSGENIKKGIFDNGFDSAYSNIKNSDFWSYKEEVFSETSWNMPGISEGLSKAFLAGYELIKKGWNGFADWLESVLTFEVNPAINPTVAQAVKALVGDKMNVLKIPRLAQGGVIPPNRQFLAMLGDQKSGTNIEAPLDTIKQAVKEVVGNNNGTVTVNLTLDRRVLAQAVVAEGKVIKATSNTNIFNF